MNKDLDKLFQKLWDQYSAINPQAQTIHRALKSKGENIVNDHIAFRTFGNHKIGIFHLSKTFTRNGYVKTGDYTFETKKLRACSYSHPNPLYPRIFISELMIEEFSAELMDLAQMLTDDIKDSVLNDPHLTCYGVPWRTISYQTYNSLLEQSEYAAWLAVWGFCANHFTISINDLKTFDDLSVFNQFVEDLGFPLNNQDGKIKGSPDKLLEQSSTLASQVELEFTDGVHKIPGCYYEFAKRYPLKDGKLFDGFVTKSADKIFESTNKRI
jgi:hypothetical protein